MEMRHNCLFIWVHGVSDIESGDSKAWGIRGLGEFYVYTFNRQQD